MSLSLWDAAASGDVDRVRELLCQGADPDLPSEGQTALIYAAANGNVEVIKLLLANGADVGFKDTVKMTALHWAVRNTEIGAAEYLLQHGADPEEESLLYGETPVYLARQRGNISMLRLVVYSTPPKETGREKTVKEEEENEPQKEQVEAPPILQETKEQNPPVQEDFEEEEAVHPVAIPVTKRVPPPPERPSNRTHTPPRHL